MCSYDCNCHQEYFTIINYNNKLKNSVYYKMTKYFTVLYCRHYAGQLSSQICFSVLVHLS